MVRRAPCGAVGGFRPKTASASASCCVPRARAPYGTPGSVVTGLSTTC